MYDHGTQTEQGFVPGELQHDSACILGHIVGKVLTAANRFLWSSFLFIDCFVDSLSLSLSFTHTLSLSMYLPFPLVLLDGRHDAV